MFEKLLIIFILVFCYKLISSISDLIRITFYKGLYSKYLNNENERFKQYAKLSADLLKKLGIKETYINGTTSSLFTNISNNSRIVSTYIKNAFESAVGVAKYNLKQCFSLFYWINLVLFLPKNILVYLNVSAESIFTKLFQLIYWIASILLTLFSDEIVEFLKSIIHFG